MPSIKACIVSVALFALTLGPVAATPLVSSAQVDVLSRRMSLPSVFELPDLSKRESRKEASERVKLAKLRAARKAKRAATIKRSPTPEPVASAAKTEELKALYKRDPEARQLAIRELEAARCYNDHSCGANRRIAALPTHGLATCDLDSHTCKVGCKSGFQFLGFLCIPTAHSCGRHACPPAPLHGIYTCSGANKCTLTCNASLGYVKKGNSCVNLSVSTNNCGKFGYRCKHSYNGVGNAKCSSGKCTLACPVGTYPRTTKRTHALYCA